MPRFPGVTSALGCVIADIRHDQVQTVKLMLGGIDACALRQRLQAEAESVEEVVHDAGLSVNRIDTVFEADMHYVGQTHTLAVRIENPFTHH